MSAQIDAPKYTYLKRGVYYFVITITVLLWGSAEAANWNKSKTNPRDEISSKHEFEIINMINQPDIAVGIELEPYTDTSLRPDRLFEETINVRTGQKALRLEIKPGDCGTPWPVMQGGWDDCSKGNERVGVNEERKRNGEWFYTTSLFLDRETFSQISTTQTHINLMQWLDQDAQFGPPFNLMWFWRNPTASYLNLPSVRIPPMSLVFDNRLSKFHEKDPQGYDSWYPMKVIGTDSAGNSITNTWLDFVVYANWSSNSDGWFLVALNDEVIVDYRGSTIELGSSGLVFDVQLYRYGSRRLASINSDGVVQGDTHNVMIVDNIGVFGRLDELEANRPNFSSMAKVLQSTLGTRQAEDPKFQPPSKTTYETLNLRYEDCSASALCDY